jgi:hypothetical protein
MQAKLSEQISSQQRRFFLGDHLTIKTVATSPEARGFLVVLVS